MGRRGSSGSAAAGAEARACCSGGGAAPRHACFGFMCVVGAGELIGGRAIKGGRKHAGVVQKGREVRASEQKGAAGAANRGTTGGERHGACRPKCASVIVFWVI